MNDLKTNYLGLSLKNPIIAASSPATGNIDDALKLQNAGAAAIVMRSIFEEEIRAEIDPLYDALDSSSSAAALEYLRADLPMQLGPEKYVKLVKTFKRELSIPVIASVNCTTASNWTLFAQKIENAGADAIELNIYDIPVNIDEDSGAIESRHIQLIGDVTSRLKIPVAVKLSSSYTALLNFARRAQQAGAKGLVFFNRFLQPDINLKHLALEEKIHFSTKDDLRLPLRWVAIARDALQCDIALSGGVRSHEGAIKAILAGANAVYVCSAIYSAESFDAITSIIRGLDEWMAQSGHSSLDEFRGLLRERNLSDGRGFERAHYVNILHNA